MTPGPRLIHFLLGARSTILILDTVAAPNGGDDNDDDIDGGYVHVQVCLSHCLLPRFLS